MTIAKTAIIEKASMAWGVQVCSGKKRTGVPERLMGLVPKHPQLKAINRIN